MSSALPLPVLCALVLLVPGCDGCSAGPHTSDTVVAPDSATGIDMVAWTPDGVDTGEASVSSDVPDVYSGFIGKNLVCTLTAGAYICPILKDIPCRPDSNDVFRCNYDSMCMSCAAAPWKPPIWPDPAPWYASTCLLWPLGDGISLCIWMHSAACAPCNADADCEVSFGGGSLDASCIDYGPEGHFCATYCDHVQCPDGYACVPTTGTAGKTQAACRRIDGKCRCPQLPFVDRKTVCHPVGLPDCAVTRTCVDGVLTPCDGAKCSK